MNVKPISIDLIRTDGGTQMRAALNQDVYLDYRDKWLAGVEFDAIDVFHDGSAYWLADGFHRFYGAREAKRSSLPCRIHQGTQRDAILFATGANAAHGLRRTNADKRLAVEALLNDGEWVKWSDNKLAEQAAVSHLFVANIRRELATVASSPAAAAAEEPRVGRDGKSRRPPQRRHPPSKPPAKREPGDESENENGSPEKKPPSLATIKKDGKRTIAGPPYDVKAINAQFGAVMRSIDDMARAMNLNNSPPHRKTIVAVKVGIAAFETFTKLCDNAFAKRK